VLEEKTLYKLTEFIFYNLFEILGIDWGLILHQCAFNESKKTRRSSFWFGSSTENKNHSPLLHEEPNFKQRGYPTILPSFIIGLLIHCNFFTIK